MSGTKKPAGALENFQIGRDHIRTFLASCKDPEKAAKAKIQLAETEARIKDIEEGIRKLGKWIAEDERTSKKSNHLILHLVISYRCRRRIM